MAIHKDLFLVNQINTALTLLCIYQEISALPFWRDQLDAMSKFGMKAEIEGSGLWITAFGFTAARNPKY
jgi:hypothetical protein